MPNPTFRDLIECPTVVNVRDEEFDIYIGRASFGWADSKWRNPYRITFNRSRQQAIAAYRSYIQTRPDLLRALSELSGKRLGCWCAPLPCHGDVLVELWKEAYPDV